MLSEHLCGVRGQLAGASSLHHVCSGEQTDSVVRLHDRWLYDKPLCSISGSLAVPPVCLGLRRHYQVFLDVLSPKRARSSAFPRCWGISTVQSGFLQREWSYVPRVPIVPCASFGCGVQHSHSLPPLVSGFWALWFFCF